MHPPEGAAWLVWLETSALALAMRQWQWLYPIVEILHILGFVLVVGGAFFFDLRLLGRSRSLPVSGLSMHLLTWSRAGFALVVPTGFMMFTAHATEFAVNPAFRLKLILIAGGPAQCGRVPPVAVPVGGALEHLGRPRRRGRGWPRWCPSPAGSA